jgi:hypothetical protein
MQSSKLTKEIAIELLSNREWRLNNLYYIKNPKGERIPFKPNWAQKEVLFDPHPFKIILKARQLGMTTAICIDNLDRILWSRNTQVGTIAHTLGDAEDIFKDKLKFSFDNLDARIRGSFRLIGDSAKELSLSNGSVIRVGTSLRSSTLQSLHITEFGKVCAKSPEKAREIITGSLNTVHVGQSITIESTAEGKEGKFYEMCQKSRSLKGKELSPLDFKFFFFPWWKHPGYRLTQTVEIPDHLIEYFDKLALEGMSLDSEQKWWYAKKYETQKEDMLREYPSTPDEAFAASQEGFWYASYMKEIYDAGHVTNVSYDKALPVHTAWDLGQADFMAIWFFQFNRSGDINIIDYFQRSNTPISQIAQILSSKGYTYGTNIWPHDANARDRAGITFVQQARSFGIQGIVLDPHSLLDGINVVRTTLSKCWFDKNKCKEGLICLESYSKKWSNNLGGFTSEPVHNEASHGADAFRYLCVGLKKISPSGSLDNDYKALRNFWGSN